MAFKPCLLSLSAVVGPLGFPPLQQAQIVELACLEPIARGLHITHWSSRELARQAVRAGIVSAISPSSIQRLLNSVDLRPHRTRYWRTVRCDLQFQQRAERVLWCYANAQRLADENVWVVCVDEIPNRQVLERKPIRRAIPGSIEQREFEYIRHGTVNILTFLVVHNGKMRVVCVERNDSIHFLKELKRFRSDYSFLKGVFLVHDGGSSHTSKATSAYFESSEGWWRPRITPTHASWLNQNEILNNQFGARYLRRGSWTSRQELIKHIHASYIEYNRLYAKPIEWTWTSQKMRKWYDQHTT